MENIVKTHVDTLYMSSNGSIYRISPDCVVLDQQIPVELSYAAFLRLSNKDSQVGVDTLLSSNAIADGVGYTSRNISVLHIPNVGMAWASRVCTVIPRNVAQTHNISNRRIGTDFLFLWPPWRALAAYLTVVEQTRIDNRTRFLSTCDPTPTSLFTDWNAAITNAGTPVDLSTLTVSQRIFAASFKPMVHLASPRYTIDHYCIRRAQEESFMHTNAPIQLKYSGLKRLRRGEDEFPKSSTAARRRALDFFIINGQQEATSGPKQARTSHCSTADDNTTPVMTGFTELLHGKDTRVANGGTRSASRPTTSTLWESNLTEDVQCCIIEAVVHQALNTMDDTEAVKVIRNARLVCKAFRKMTDHGVHSVLVDAYSKAKRLCEPTAEARRLDGLLLTRSWWDSCRLPYMGILTYNNDTPRTSVATLASIVANNNHKPYPRCSAIPALDTSSSKRKATMQYLQKLVNDLATCNSGFRMPAIVHDTSGLGRSMQSN
jgi:hypothetical protein